MNEPKLPQLQPDIGVTRLDPSEAPDFTVYEQSEAKVSVERAAAYGQECYAAGVAASLGLTPQELQRIALVLNAHEDRGPLEEGYQSDELSSLAAKFAAAIRKGETP